MDVAGACPNAGGLMAFARIGTSKWQYWISKYNDLTPKLSMFT